MPNPDLNPAPGGAGGPAEAAPAGGGSALRGVGIDAEQLSRFGRLAGAPRFRRLVCTPAEAAHLAAQPSPESAFCAAFCCKEALYKALGGGCAARECACFWVPGAGELELALSPELRARSGLAGAQARMHGQFAAERGECVVEVHALGVVPGGRAPQRQGSRPAVRSRIGTTAIADAERDRRGIEERCLTRGELADLGGRRVQSLAGLLALKRALVSLWDEVVLTGPVDPREFEIAHGAAGAPRLVSVPGGLAPADVFVSISHTRRWAYGLAAVEGETLPR